MLSKLLSGQAQPVNAAKYGASYRATWRYCGVSCIWEARKVCPKRVVKTRGVKDDLRQCRRASSHTGATGAGHLAQQKEVVGSCRLKKSWLEKWWWNQFLLWIYKIGHIRSIDYIYTYIWYEDRTHAHIYSTSYVNTRVPKTMKPLHWNVFCFYEALVSLCSPKSLEPLSMRWYWRSYSLFKMVPTSSLCALHVRFPSDFSADQIPNQLNWPTK